MKRQIIVTVFGACLLAKLVGCSAPQKLEHPPLQFSGHTVRTLADDIEALRGRAKQLDTLPLPGASMQMQIAIIAPKPEYLAEYCADTKTPACVLDKTKYDALLQRLQFDRARGVMFSDFLAAPWDERCYVTLRQDEIYAQDYRRTDASGVFAPAFSNLQTGLLITLTTRLEGEEVVFAELQPRIVSAVLRECKAKIPAAGQTLRWWEPVVTTATASIEQPCAFRLKADEALLVMFDRLSVEQGCSNLRALLMKDEVKEKYDTFQSGIAPSEIALLITAQPVPEQAENN